MRTKLAGLYDLHGEKLRYLVVGACNTAISYVLFLLLLATLGPLLRGLEGSSSTLVALVGRYYYLVVQWVAWVFMVPLSTVTMKYLVFRSKGEALHEVGKAYFVYLPAQGVSSAILWLAVKILHLPPAAGQVLAIVFATVFSYFGHKHFTFGAPKETQDG